MATPLLLAQLDGNLAYDNGDLGGDGVWTGVPRFTTGNGSGSQAAIVASGAANLLANPVAYSSTDGWNTYGRSARTTILPAPVPGASGITTGFVSTVDSTGTNLSALRIDNFSVAGPGEYTLSAFIYIPSTWTGGDIRLNNQGWSGGANASQTANMAARDTWQRVSARATVVSGDLHTGVLLINVQGIWNAGESFYVTAIQMESGSTATDFTVAGSISLPLAIAPSETIARYSNNGGANWGIAFVTTLSGINVGTGGQIRHDGVNLSVSSVDETIVGPIFAFSDTLTSVERATLEAADNWTIDMQLAPTPGHYTISRAAGTDGQAPIITLHV